MRTTMLALKLLWHALVSVIASVCLVHYLGFSVYTLLLCALVGLLVPVVFRGLG